jgi:phosphoribosylamine--glycine ligase
MKILVVGSGGREHTISWKIKKDVKDVSLFVAPGNAGTSFFSKNVDIKAEDIKGLLDFVKSEKIDITLVGPEAPLVKGIVDEFEKNNLKIFGPNKSAARIEGSKIFAKKILTKYQIPTAKAEFFDDSKEAKKYLKKISPPVVVKADGLAQGKGVIVCKELKEAIYSVEEMMENKIFGESGSRILIEEFLEGKEFSLLGFTDGEEVIPLVAAKDYKRVFDRDKGPNTGGMGSYSPPVFLDKKTLEISCNILKRTIESLNKEGIIYKGVLYGGLILTKKGPYVLEFNCRFGDPETQVILPRLKTNLLEIIEAVIEKRLKEIKVRWSKNPAVCVVLVSGGYPGKYEVGKEISGLEKVEKMKKILLFHAGTKRENSKILTSGGRVINVVSVDRDIKTCRKNVYSAIKKIKFENMHYRKDIAKL